ncbi:MAG TPA: hypothetical protein VGK40_12065 [Verrucomicrobiae bacterium]|jgi:hypothetical protein
MRAVLHITTRPDDALALAVLARQSGQAELQVDVVDLTAPEPDYQALLERIFAADSVQVW